MSLCGAPVQYIFLQILADNFLPSYPNVATYGYKKLTG